MVAVLFLVGKRLERPSIVDELLDIVKHPVTLAAPPHPAAPCSTLQHPAHAHTHANTHAAQVHTHMHLRRGLITRSLLTGRCCCTTSAIMTWRGSTVPRRRRSSAGTGGKRRRPLCSAPPCYMPSAPRCSASPPPPPLPPGPPPRRPPARTRGQGTCRFSSDRPPPPWRWCMRRRRRGPGGRSAPRQATAKPRQRPEHKPPQLVLGSQYIPDMTSSALQHLSLACWPPLPVRRGAQPPQVQEASGSLVLLLCCVRVLCPETRD